MAGPARPDHHDRAHVHVAGLELLQPELLGSGEVELVVLGLEELPLDGNPHPIRAGRIGLFEEEVVDHPQRAARGRLGVRVRGRAPGGEPEDDGTHEPD